MNKTRNKADRGDCYFNNLLCISHDPINHMNGIQSTLKFRNNKLEETDFYLGETLSKKELNGKKYGQC